MSIFDEVVYQIQWYSPDSALQLPLYLYTNSMTVSLAIERWWRQKKADALDIYATMRLIHGIIDSFSKQARLRNSSEKILFTPAYPEWLFDSDVKAEPHDTNRVVTWNVTRTSPASLSGQPFGHPRELRPRLREIIQIQDANEDYYTVEIKGHWYDCLVRFECFAPSVLEASKVADDFEAIMEMQRNYMLQSGVQKVFWWGRGQTTTNTKTRWHSIPIDFYFRTEKIYVDMDRSINQILVDASVWDGGREIPPMVLQD